MKTYPLSASDILSDPTLDVVFIPVNMVGVMGKGLAKQFADTYPNLIRAYHEGCEDGRVRNDLSGVSVTDVATGIEYVFFPTKDHWRDMSRINDIVYRLLHILHANESRWLDCHIGLPMLGMGLGGIRKSDGIPAIANVLDEFNLNVTFYDNTPYI